MKGNLLEKYAAPRPAEVEKPEEQAGVADDLGAFGYLRGVHDRALMLEFRFKNGKRRGLGYAWLHDVEFDPSEGITLHFGGHKVKITGRNLNADVQPNVRLFAAILRHRVPWIQEADGPTMMVASKGATVIEGIEVK
jgi:hypothetical protein